MTTEREAWLAQTIEDPIDPELPICDTHHHLWDSPNNRYLLEDFMKDAEGGHNIVHTVFLDCRARYRTYGPPEMQPVGETEFVEDIANRSATGQYGKTRVAAGIVSHADLRLGAAVVPVLEAHMAASKRFRGIRHISAWLEDSNTGFSTSAPRLLYDPKFREGFACLQEYGLSFDTWMYHTQLMELVDLARAFPDAPIILNHIGTPLGVGPYALKREEVFQDWKSGIAELATCPNVIIKLGGLGMWPPGFGWHELAKPLGSAELAKAMAPYFLWCIEKFGADRCMFESNFPVDKMSYSYTVMWNAFKRVTEGFSPSERAALFNDTAVKVYRL